ncbi:YqaJ viral recombinase family protein [Brachybacterium sp. NBEC-018]|uniref:YqaJ viral recombinase family nuclease n=1 Tax=Brachybacterium sp. NBEC-018 TaxID=2996004 RepID=UPI0021752B54|nr:YqaJ viral recombinase family protein [Brachybacterium sp. NBEC-018]UVY83836.1 YqaJ viral recombinase family protein [Brachybacterium sp. NBEC-018]
MPAIARQILRADADGTAEWLAQRTEGFGGTDAAHLHNGVKSRFALWREKRGLAAREEVTPELQALFDYGHSREPELARIFSERTGRRVRNTGTWARKDHPWMLANPDRLVGSDGLLEIKTTGAYTDAAKHWRDGRVPPHAWVQAHWYAHVTGRKVLWFIAEVDRVPYILGPFDRDEDLIGDLVLESVDLWNLVADDRQPDPSTADDMPVAYPVSSEGKVVEIDPWAETVTDVERLAELKVQAKDIAEEIKHLETGIKGEMGDAEALATTDGRVLVTWKSQARKGGIDTKALAEKAGLDVEDFRKPSTTSRTFLVKGA